MKFRNLFRMNEWLFKINKPCLFKNILLDSETYNSAVKWTPNTLQSIFGHEKFMFRVGPKEAFIFENECETVEASIKEFIEWKTDKSESRNPFFRFDTNKYWAYADYKYMSELTNLGLDESCINWSAFGFLNRNANDSTFWLASKGAFTPCHYDSYGYNLVAQIYGKKRWIMFGPNDTPFMYPTRIPFEESTVYSQVNIKRPNLNRYPLFESTKPYVVELEPGDVLYVPNNWWHYVESLSESISINTWVELKEKDDIARLKEILSRTLIQNVMESNFVEFESWANLSEIYSSTEENLKTIKECLNAINSETQKSTENTNELIQLEKELAEHPKFSRFIESSSFSDLKQFFLNNNFPSDDEKVSENMDKVLLELCRALIHPETVEMITKKLIENLKK